MQDSNLWNWTRYFHNRTIKPITYLDYLTIHATRLISIALELALPQTSPQDLLTVAPKENWSLERVLMKDFWHAWELDGEAEFERGVEREMACLKERKWKGREREVLSNGSGWHESNSCELGCFGRLTVMLGRLSNRDGSVLRVQFWIRISKFESNTWVMGHIHIHSLEKGLGCYTLHPRNDQS